MKTYNILCFTFKPDPNWCSHRPRTAKVNLTIYSHMYHGKDRDLTKMPKYEVWVENIGDYLNTLEEVASFISCYCKDKLTSEEELEILSKLKEFKFE